MIPCIDAAVVKELPKSGQNLFRTPIYDLRRGNSYFSDCYEATDCFALFSFFTEFL